MSILSYYSQFVKEGGRLVYATCSLMADENEEVIKNFLENNKQFVPKSLKESFEQYGIAIQGLGSNDFMLNLNPLKHGTDGFFMALMIKI